MPKESTDLRQFLQKARQKDAKYVKVKKGTEKKGDKVVQYTKFKLRLSRYLYTLKINDPERAKKISESFPPGLKKEELKK